MTSSLIPDTANYDLNLQLQACQSHSRRNGKVARLPAALRNQINRMMDDGIPYRLIIEKLGPAGRHLNEDNLSNWRLGGYQDHLKARVIKDRARMQIEAAAEFVHDNGHLDHVKLQQTCSELALVKYIHTIMKHGTQCASDALKRNPAKLITLINACANMSNANIAIEKRRLAKGDPQRSDARRPDAPLAPANPPTPRESSDTQQLKTKNSSHLPNPSEPNRTPKNLFSHAQTRSNG